MLCFLLVLYVFPFLIAAQPTVQSTAQKIQLTGGTNDQSPDVAVVRAHSYPSNTV